MKTQKPAKRFVVMSVPGDDSDPTTWYAYDRQQMSGIRCEDREIAAEVVRLSNFKASLGEM